MAKEKILNKSKGSEELLVLFNEFQPTKADPEHPGKTIGLVNENGEPVLVETFSTRLPILGKMIQFTLYTKEKTEKSILADFFRIKDTKELPLVLTESSFKTETGETVKTVNAKVVFDEIHQIALKCADQDRGKWNMAVKEYLQKYEVSDAIRNYRRDNYERALLASAYKHDEIIKMNPEQRKKAIAELEEKRQKEYEKRLADKVAKDKKTANDDLPF